MVFKLLLLACKVPPSDSQTDTGERSPPVWDAEAAPIDCAFGAAAPLLDAALVDADLLRQDVGYTAIDWFKAPYYFKLDDPFLLSWFQPHLFEPLRLPCLGGQVAQDLDHALTTEHPVAVALGEAMALLDVPPQTEAPLFDVQQDLVELPEPDLQRALTPVFAAMQQVAQARDALEPPESVERMVTLGHGGVVLDFESAPDLTDEGVQEWAVEASSALFEWARLLAFAIEDAQLERWLDQSLSFEADTPLGKVILAGPGDDAPGELGAVAFYLDLGGDDTYVHPAGASGEGVPVAVHIDLGGNDDYGYAASGSGTDALLPPDEAGRYGGDDYYGPFSLSRQGRQGAGTYGVGLLFDMGGDDRYTSLRMSQGWAHFGVGVLFDAEGDDVYLAEEASQGSASMGIGLLMDLAGDDVHESYANSQGFGYVRGAGLVVDAAGDDTWYVNPGKEEDGGTTLYYSPQLPSGGNSSFSQGAGFGMRNDNAGTFLSGGVGVLRDVAGDDTYMAGTFAQGSGYWQGTGLLLDGEGSDLYDAYYYVQGGAAHYAVGVLLDMGPGDDGLNTRMAPNYMHFGAGHDYSAGVHINEEGDETYVYAGLAAGASNCQGVGVFADNGGSDTYLASSTYSTGLGNHSGECESRKEVDSIGLFLDSGGDADTYVWPEDELRTPADDSTFGISWNGTQDEKGGGIDGDGETALHADGGLAD